MKKLWVVLLAMVMAFALAACGGKTDGDGMENEEQAFVTVEKYNELCNADWSDMSFEEMEEFLGVRGVIDEDRTDEWGEGYLVVDFPGPDSNSKLLVLYSQDEEGEWGTSSLSPSGALSE